MEAFSALLPLFRVIHRSPVNFSQNGLLITRDLVLPLMIVHKMWIWDAITPMWRYCNVGGISFQRLAYTTVWFLVICSQINLAPYSLCNDETCVGRSFNILEVIHHNICIMPNEPCIAVFSPSGRLYASVNWVNIDSGYGLSPIRRQAITWISDGLLSIGLLGTSFSEFWIGILSFQSRKCIWKCRLPKWRPFYSGQMS